MTWISPETRRKATRRAGLQLGAPWRRRHGSRGLGWLAGVGMGDYNEGMIRRIGMMVLFAAAGLAGGCALHIVGLVPVREVREWQLDAGAATETAPAGTMTAPAETASAPAETMAAGMPATASATGPTTAPATQPGHMVTRVVDPNQTVRFVYKATYDTVWQQATLLLNKLGFTLDRRDYRLGVITTQPLMSAQIVEFWKTQQVNVSDSMENTVNSQRRHGAADNFQGGREAGFL